MRCESRQRNSPRNYATMRIPLALSRINSLSLSSYPSRRIRFVCPRPRLGGGRGGLLPSPPLAMPAGHAMGWLVGASREACEQKHQRVRALGGAMRREATEILPRRRESAMAPAMRIASVQDLIPVCMHITMPKGGTLEGSQAASWRVHASARKITIAESTSQGGRARGRAALSRENRR